MKKSTLYGSLLAYACISLLTILLFNGTGDAGDSVHHYLFARYATNHPELFFDHWAKPLYVLLASPFAQFGFIGVKVFNVMITFFTLTTVYKIAEYLELKNSILVLAFIVFSPLVFILTFSGLTEPLFALLLSMGILFSLKERFLVAAIIISFLPFVRSEGLILVGVFGLFFLLKRELKYIPALLVGHFIYSILGYFVHGDILWVFTKIPYATTSSVYGHGSLFHFVEQLIYVVGIPIYLLLFLGSIVLIWKMIKCSIRLETSVLILLGFASFFIAHSLFWYLGIFNSMGLKRVFIAVMPLMAIIALVGFNFMTEELIKKKKARLWIQGFMLILVFIFPFTKSPAAINFEQTMKLNTDQLTAKKAADFIKLEMGTNNRFLYAHPYLSCTLNIDHFDYNVHGNLDQYNLKNLSQGEIIIWENWFAPIEFGIDENYLSTIDNLELLYSVKNEDEGREIIYKVYQKQ